MPLCHKATESFLLLPWTVPAFVAAWPSQLQRVRATPCCGARAPGLASPWSWGSLALGCRLSGCGPWAPLLRGRWDLPSSGLEPVPPASAGKFFNTEPPEESHGRLNQIFTDSFFHEAEGTVVLEAGFSSILYEFLEGNNEERSKFLGKKERRREKSLGFPEMIFTNLSKFTSL